MATEIKEKFDLKFGGTPPGMSRVDNILWQKYKPDISDRCEAIYFNVHLGKGIDPGETQDIKWRQYWIQKTQLRADAILVYKDKVKIVEFRDRATASVVGRVLAYRTLLLTDNPFRGEVETEVVTNIYSEIVETLCKAQGINYKVI